MDYMFVKVFQLSTDMKLSFELLKYTDNSGVFSGMGARQTGALRRCVFSSCIVACSIFPSSSSKWKGKHQPNLQHDCWLNMSLQNCRSVNIDDWWFYMFLLYVCLVLIFYFSLIITRSWFGLKHLLWSPQSQMKMVWFPMRESQFSRHKSVVCHPCWL